MDMKFLKVTGVLLALLVAAWILLPMLEPKMVDPYSADCRSGMAGTDSGCVPLLDCKSDLDCKYLEKDNLPPRYGRCEYEKCKTYCGSGRIMECVN